MIGCFDAWIFVVADWSLAQAAATFKSRHKLSYADAFAAALAKQNRAHLVTGDREFRSLGSEVNTVWL